MMSPAPQIKSFRANLTPNAPVRPQIRALVVSGDLEIRKPLLRTLESLKVDVVSCGRRLQAQEALSKSSFNVVFCDEHLPDGSYLDLIRGDDWGNKIPRVVVTTRNGDWDLYFQALAKGAFDVIRCPCYATDVEMMLIRVLREDQNSGLSMVE